MVKIKIEKIQLSDGDFSVHFFPEMDELSQQAIAAGNHKVDLSRQKIGNSLFRVDQLDQHNNHASLRHTEKTVDEYIKRVMIDITEVLEKDGLTVESDVEKVKGILIPFPVFADNTSNQNN